ncbi:GNAT family N-acetyltransferase [Endozoicomonas sp. SESOKO2]|uniref:GNAT family N-acetyltransferase n=1 Tax=Endozoicomonas sp. SESOKO2 TaxID=2828743 RepID=UPI002149970B|nr:GNAT family N-acetyltransferase [Endozoicomonas sp. SESOKO2]
MEKIITTDRLILRAFTPQDAGQVEILAGEEQVARLTENIPHPYPDGLAEEWIKDNESLREKNNAFVYAITLKSSDTLLGAIGLTNTTHTQAELGYWLGLPYWGQGYCSEAGQSLISHAFEQLPFNQIRARALTKNVKSERVLLRLGFRSTSEILEKVKEDMDTVKYYVLDRNHSG